MTSSVSSARVRNASMRLIKRASGSWSKSSRLPSLVEIADNDQPSIHRCASHKRVIQTLRDRSSSNDHFPSDAGVMRWPFSS